MSPLTAVGLYLALAGAAPIDLYVAPTGSDQADGRTAATAFATLARARDELRRLRPGGATVHVAAGTYRLTEPLALGPEDSGVTWQGAGAGQTVLTAALPVTGFQPWRNGIVRADLKGTPLEKVAFRQLFFAGQRMVLARYPNLDPNDPHGGAWAYVAHADKAPATNRSVSDNVPRTKDHFTATTDVIKPTWEHVERAEVGIHPAYGWAWNIVPVKSAEAQTKVIRLARPVSYGLMIGDRYYVQNLLAELDAPGEWFLDRDAAQLYFLPPAPLATGEVSVPVSKTVIALKGAANVTLRGFTIEGCDANAVELLNGERCRVAASVIRNTGAWAVLVNGGHQTGVAGCDIYATGAGGVSLNGGDRKTLERGDNYADNNYIHHIAAFQRTYNTGVNLNGVGNRATHNLIHDCYHQGILIGGNDQLVEYNVIHHTNLGSEDTGGVYMSSRDYTMRGTVIRYNTFHHIGGFGKANSWNPVAGGKVQFIYPAFTWGIYLDAPEVGVTVFGNLLYDVPVCGLFNHEGHDNNWENNIIVDAPAFQVSAGGYPDLDEQSYSYVKKLRANGGYGPYRQRYPELDTYTDDPATHHTCATSRFVHNIAYYRAKPSQLVLDRRKREWAGAQLVWSWRGLKADFPKFSFDGNCLWAPPGVELKFRVDRLPDAGQLLGWEQWRQTGHDPHSLVADPLFVDPEHHDYHLRPNSPVRALGFKDLPLDEMGPYASPDRASWPVVEAKGAAALGDFTTERYFEVPGFEPVKSAEVQARGGLPRLAQKLADKQPVTIVCFAGGNHAQGGWFDGFVKAFQAAHPGVPVKGILSSIHGGARGSGFSVYRFEHEALRHQPDLIFIDFASDDSEVPAETAQAAVEGMIRQAWRADPAIDLALVYSFRAGYEKELSQGLCPSVVSGYERLAQHYGIPAINLGARFTELLKAGKLQVKGAAEPGKLVFTADGVYTSPVANALGAEVVAEDLAKLLTATPVAVDRAQAMVTPVNEENLENARQFAITPAMVSGQWTQEPAGPWVQHFDGIWTTRQPGAKLSFKFKGTAVALFDLMGPNTGRARVTIDGRDRGTRQQVDRWCTSERISQMTLAQGLPDGEHTVTVELLPEPPDRGEPMAAAKGIRGFDMKVFEGVSLRIGWIRIVGEPI